MSIYKEAPGSALNLGHPPGRLPYQRRSSSHPGPDQVTQRLVRAKVRSKAPGRRPVRPAPGRNGRHMAQHQIGHHPPKDHGAMRVQVRAVAGDEVVRVRGVHADVVDVGEAGLVEVDVLRAGRGGRGDGGPGLVGEAVCDEACRRGEFPAAEGGYEDLAGVV